MYFWLTVQENQIKLANMAGSGSQFSQPWEQNLPGRFCLGGCVYESYSEWQIIGMMIIFDFYYQLSVVLMIPHLWELDVSMMEMMFYMSADNVEFSLMSATLLELITLNQWTTKKTWDVAKILTVRKTQTTGSVIAIILVYAVVIAKWLLYLLIVK